MQKINSLLALVGLTALLNSCSATQGEMTQAVGNAVVDTALKDSDPLTKEIVRQRTGYGTAPEQTAAQRIFKGLGL